MKTRVNRKDGQSLMRTAINTKAERISMKAKKTYKKNFITKTLCMIAAMLLCIGLTGVSVWAADSYSASSMRLLHYEGDVQILDADGQPRFVLENIRFDSGETLITGENSTASVELDEERIVTLDSRTSVEFIQQGDSMKMNLKEGTILLDVGKKLDQNESLDIATSNMTVGIRGTVVYMSHIPEGDPRLQELSESTLSKLLPLMEQGTALAGTASTEAANAVADGAANVSVADGAAANAGAANANAAAAGTAAATAAAAAATAAADAATAAANAAAAGTNAAANAATAGTAAATAAADAPAAAADGAVTVFGVVQGNADISWLDNDGTQRSVNIPSGNKAILLGDAETETSAGPVVGPMQNDDVSTFIGNSLSPEQNQELNNLLNNKESVTDPYDPDGDWLYCGVVDLIAQSASKMYDGTPLTQRDILVSYLPEGFRVEAQTSGSQTDAGTSENPISGYTIRNYRGEDVTSHFTSIETTSGQLVVDPVPVTVQTGSAEKAYDGTPLMSDEAQITTISVSQEVKVSGQNISYINTQPFTASQSQGSTSEMAGDNLEGADSNTLYGVVGEVLVHGTNPLTGETRETGLLAGQKMTIRINDEEGKDSIEFDIENMKEEEIPLEVLRIYADNPELLAQACEETGWDPEKIQELIAALPETDEALVEENGVSMRRNDTGSTLQDSTNVRINIDTDITDYNDRPLEKEEFRYIPITVDPSIKVTATGSQTEAGESVNTYEIDWGEAKEGNYIVSEDLGTLTVTPAPLTITTGSASKVYDGQPITSAEGSIAGLASGESAEVVTTGSQTNVGTSQNTYQINWGSADPDNYTIAAENLGTLEVTPAPLTITINSISKVYDGQPLTGAEISITGLVNGETAALTETGSITGVGTAQNSYQISWGSANPENYSIAIENIGTMTVTPAPLTVTTGSAEKEYDGTELTCEEASISGLVAGETATVIATGSQTEVGSSTNTYTISWGSADPANYTVSEELGTLTVTPKEEKPRQTLELTITTGSASKVYDGTPLTSGESTITGLADGDEAYVTVTGSQTNAGTSQNTYQITWGADNQNDYTVIENLGTLTVTPAALTVTTGSAGKTYDGTALTSEEASVSGLAAGDEVAVTATGSQTDAGSSTNTYSVNWGNASESNYTVTENLGTLTVTPAAVTATITGNKDRLVYNGNEQMAEGYTVSISNALYKEADITFSGEAAAKGTDAGTYPMGLSQDQFTNNNENFDITFEVTDGELEITRLAVTVSITGNKNSPEYSGAEQTVEGYTVSISDGLYTEADFTFSGKALAKGTIPDTYPMGLAADQFTNNNDNFDVTFEVTDGELEITPNTTAITFTAKTLEKVYDGEPLYGDAEASGVPAGFYGVGWVSASRTDAGTTDYDVEEYAIYIDDGGEENVTEYFSNISTESGTLEIMKKEVTVTITGNTNTDKKEYNGTEHKVEGYAVSVSDSLYTEDDFTFTGSAVAAGTIPGTYPMGLAADQFTNNNDNFDVTFEVTDGGLTVTANTSPVTFIAQSKTKVYDGDPYDPLYGEFEVTGLPEGFFGVGWSNAELINADSIGYDLDGHGIYTSEEVEVTEYFTNIQSVPGTLTVTPRPVTVTITGNTGSAVYNGTEQKVEGYTVSIGDSLYKESDFSFSGGAATGTDVGKHLMGLTAGKFTNNNANFNVTFNVTDGELEITKLPVTVTITGNTASMGYNNEEQQVEGYAVSASSNLYKDSYVTISGNAVAKGKEVGTYQMNLTESQFSNNNGNFDVTFSVTDGALTITKIDVVFNLRGGTVQYNGERYPQDAELLLYNPGGYNVNPNGYLGYPMRQDLNNDLETVFEIYGVRIRLKITIEKVEGSGTNLGIDPGLYVLNGAWSTADTHTWVNDIQSINHDLHIIEPETGG